MTGAGRTPGWYPDPWGTDDDRYFDGEAWARTTRGQGAPDAPAIAVPATPTARPAAAPAVEWPAASAGAPTQPPAPAPEQAAPPVPPGWYADPWGNAPLRYWDGTQWTGHLSGSAAGVADAPRLEEERTAGRWAKLGLAWGAPALAISTIAGAFQWRWIGDHWDELTRSGGTVEANGNNGAAIAYQLSGLVLLVAGVLFLLWFYRAAANARSAGITARRGPGLATFSFIIPILNLWWPYQSTCDLLPADHPARILVRRWWALWISCTVGGIAVAGAALVNDIALAVTTGVVAVLAVMAAVAARNVVTEVGAAHGQLMAGTS